MDVEHEETAAVRARRPAAMSDVGRLAGVSHQTVSRVINGSPNVRPETRQRVITAMRELGYRPNSVARALATGRTKMLGVVGFDTTLYGPASTLFGIERAAHEAGYFMIVASLKALNRSSVMYAVERLLVQGVDGILVIAPHQEVADALRHPPGGCRRPVRRCGQRDPAPARPRPPVGVAHLGAVAVAGGAGASRRLAHDARGRRCGSAAPARRRLERTRRL
jgi:Bacterial regulatory proteins, lacI family